VQPHGAEEESVNRTRGTRWLWLLFSLFAVVALVAAACGDDDDDDDGGDDDGGDQVTYGAAGFKTVEVAAGAPIKIGISSILSGDLKAIGEPIVAAAQLAGEGVTIKGHKVEFVAKDDTCSAEGGASAASQILAENVVAVIGPVCSGAVVASQPQYEAAGITHVSPSSTAHTPTHPTRGQVFQTFLRTTYSDDIQGPVQADFAYNTLGLKSAYIVHDTDAYGTGLADSFTAAFEKLGGEILGREGYEKGATDFQAVVTNVQREKPELLYFAGFFAEATPFIKQLRAANKDLPFLAGDGVKNDDFIKGAGADANGSYQTLPSPVYDSPAFQAFGTKYEAKTGQKKDASPFLPESYDAVTIILKALEQVAKDDGGKLTIDLKALNEAIRKQEIDGAAGHIKFDARGENVGGETPVTLFKIEGGAYKPVER
jgi:branched-chain amino acid transport system substrate-binding protein